MVQCSNRQRITLALSLVCLFFSVAKATAQDQKTNGLSDEIKVWTQSAIIPWPEGRYKNYKEAMIDNKIFVPFVFRGIYYPEIAYETYLDSIRRVQNRLFQTPIESIEKKDPFKSYKLHKELEDRVYKNVLLKDPSNFKYTLAQLPKTAIKPESITIPLEQVKLDVEKTTPPPATIDPILKFIPDRKYWKSAFKTDIKFSQNKSSDNWSGGKTNNMNIVIMNQISYNYQRGKATLTNQLNTNNTYANAPNDTLRKYTVGTDELKIESKLAIDAVKNWKYTFTVRFISAMFNKYITNTETKYAAFLAPFTTTVSIGPSLDKNFKVKKPDRSWKIVITPSPLTYDFKYSIDKDINLAGHFAKNKDGLSYRFVQQTVGALSFTMDNYIRFNKNMLLTSKFYYITNYKFEYTEGFFENTLDITLNKYFSTKIYMKLVYNDRIAKAPDSKTHLQINELFSFGFVYSW